MGLPCSPSHVFTCTEVLVISLQAHTYRGRIDPPPRVLPGGATCGGNLIKTKAKVQSKIDAAMRIVALDKVFCVIMARLGMTRCKRIHAGHDDSLKMETVIFC